MRKTSLSFNASECDYWSVEGASGSDSLSDEIPGSTFCTTTTFKGVETHVGENAGRL